MKPFFNFHEAGTMPNPDEILESASDDLAEARAKFEATRAALQAAPDAPEIWQALARLDRIAAELGKVENALAEKVPARS